MKKRVPRIFTVFSLIIAVMIVYVLPANAAFTVPQHGLLVDSSDTTIKASAMRAGQIAPMILGANLVATSNLGALQDANTKNPNSLLGVFGSNANSNPDPYLYNYFFNNAYADANKLQRITEATSAVQQLDGTGQTPEVILEALTNRPHLILSQGAGTGSATQNESYVAVIASLPENNDAIATNDYNPSYYTCSISSLVYQCENLQNTAAVMLDIMKAENLTARYGDPTIIAKDYDKYVWGMYFYVGKQIAENNLTKKSVAIVTSTEDNGATWVMPIRSTDVAQAKPNRLVEYCRDNTNLLSDQLGESATLAQVLDCDVVVAIGKGDIIREAAEAAGVDESQLPVIIDTLPNCLYGMTMQTHENALGIPYFQSFIYSDQIDINPAYAAAYFYQKFFHVTDDAALQETVEVLLSQASLPAGKTADLTNYDPAAFEEVLAEGIDYALATQGQRHDDPAAWAPDTTVGIGSGKTTPVTYASTANKAFYPEAAATVPEEPQGTPVVFSDVDSRAAYASAVDFVTARGYFRGVSATEFNPAGNMTRAMFVTVMANLVGAEASGTSSFSDVPADSWYSRGVAWATKNAVVKGTSDTTFAPEEEINLEQTMQMLYNLTAYRGVTMGNATPNSNFTNMKGYSEISGWAQNAMNWAYNAHLITSDNNTFDPQGKVSRAQMAVILMKYMNG